MVLSGNLTKSVDALLMPHSWSTGPVLLLNIREKVSPNVASTWVLSVINDGMHQKDVLNPMPYFGADHAREFPYKKSQYCILWLVQRLFQRILNALTEKRRHQTHWKHARTRGSNSVTSATVGARTYQLCVVREQPEMRVYRPHSIFALSGMTGVQQ